MAAPGDVLGGKSPELNGQFEGRPSVLVDAVGNVLQAAPVDLAPNMPV